MATTTERRCRVHGRFSSVACPTCGLPPADTPPAAPTPARNGRSLSYGVVVYYAERAIPSLGVLPGDRIVTRPSGAVMVTRFLTSAQVAAAAAEPDAPVRPPCTVEGCSVGDCATCRYISALEAQLGAARQP
jgi:hypothetical protein